MNIEELLELKQVVAAFIGAGLALGVQWLVSRAKIAATGRALCIAFGEEFNAARIDVYEQKDPHGTQGEFAFALSRVSTQTFDSLFREMVQTLPESLARDLMRYHLSLKAIVASHGQDQFGAQRDFADELGGLFSDLLRRLKAYSERSVVRLMLWRGE